MKRYRVTIRDKKESVLWSGIINKKDNIGILLIGKQRAKEEGVIYNSKRHNITYVEV